jgi:hypothetical protein
MLDFFDVPNSSVNTSIFYANNPTRSLFENGWQTWNKPENCTFVSIVAIGGGGGGAAGGWSAASANRNGGKGGGSSSVTKTLYPAWALPSTLYIQVGNGGLGGSGSASTTILASGSDGQLSFVCIQPTSSANYVLTKSGNSVATGGGIAFGTRGAAGTAATIAFWNYLGLFESEAGVAGGNGGSSTSLPGTGVAPSFITCGGAGGGARSLSNVNYNGGMITATVLTPEVPSGSASGITAGGNGFYTSMYSTNGSMLTTPLFLGGAGGAGSATLGGNGGNGSYGCGGGGGGASVLASGSIGGRGGDGLVIITAF